MMEKCRLFFRRDLLSTDRSNIGHAPHTSEARRYQVKKIERESTCFDVTRNQGRRGLVGMVSYITWKGEKNFFLVIPPASRRGSPHGWEKNVFHAHFGVNPTRENTNKTARETKKKWRGLNIARGTHYILYCARKRGRREKKIHLITRYIFVIYPRGFTWKRCLGYIIVLIFLFNRWALLKVTHTKLLERYQQGFESILWYGEGKGICLSGAERGICWCGKRAAGKRKPKSMFVRDTSF